MNARPLVHSSPELAPLALALGALSAAGGAQLLVHQQPWWSVAGFGLAGVLIALAARRRPMAAERPPASPPALGGMFGALMAAGTVLCAAAGILVYRGWAPRLTHGVWVAGLVALAGAATWPDAGVRRPQWPARQTLACGALLALLAAVVFGWNLTSLPAEVHGDDAEVGLDAIRLLQNFNLFSAGWFELPRFHAFPTAIGIGLFGPNLLGLRATSAALGVGSVVLLFAVARRLWDSEVAVVAALLLITQRFFIHLSRTGYHYVDTPFLSLLVVWLFLRLWQDRQRGAAVWCGIALGLGIQTYYASRLVPSLLVLTWLWWLYRTPGAERRGRIAAFALVGLIALAVAAPMFGFFAHDWSAFWLRARRHQLLHPRGAPAPRVRLPHRQLRGDSPHPAARRRHAVQRHVGQLGPVRPQRPAPRAGERRPLRARRRARARAASRTTDAAGARLDGGPADRRRGADDRHALLSAHQRARAVRRAADRAGDPRPPRCRSERGPDWMGCAARRGRNGGGAGAHRRPQPAQLLRRLRAALPALAVRRDRRLGARARRRQDDVHGRQRARLLHSPRRHQFPHLRLRHPRHRRPRPLSARAIARCRRGRLRHHAAWNVHHPAARASGWARRSANTPQEQRRRGLLDGDSAWSRLGAARRGRPVRPAAYGQRSRRRVGPRARCDRCGGAGRAGGGRPGHPPVRAGGVGAPPAPPGIAALAEPWRQRLGRWQRRLAGPDARDARAALPPAVVAGLFGAIVAIALILRVVHLVDLPAGFFCDEAGNGYNAYSLLHTARDETGARLPLYVWSFGVSYKNPVFIYSAMLPMALLGPTELAVRLTAAAYGVGTVVALFFLGRALMGPTVGLLAALLLAVCPWHLHFSRIGFELITLPFFFTLALTRLVRWTQGRHALPQAMVLFGLCLYTYVPAKLIVPLFLAGFACLSWRSLVTRWRETLLAAGLLVVTAAPVAIFDLRHREQSGSYFRETTVLAQPGSPLDLARSVASNYAAFFSPEFLFADSTDRIIRHRVAAHGELYPFFAPLLVLGAAVALLRRDRALRLPLLWLGLYPLAPSLMNEIPSASRGFVGAPAFCLLAAIGAGAVLRAPAQLSRRRGIIWATQGVLALAGLAVLIPAVRHYWSLYRHQYPLYSAKYYTGFQYGHRQVLDYFRQHYDEYDLLLLTTRKSNQPDAFLRFYDGLHQPPRTDVMPPFEHRAKMIVGSAEAYDHYAPPGRRLLFAVLPEEVSLFGDAVEKERILAPDGSAAFVIVAASRLKDFVSTWRVVGLLPEDDRSPPPAWTPENPPHGAGTARWRTYDLPSAGVELNDFFMPNADHACAWAVNFVSTDTARDLRVFAGFDDSGEVWVNGEPVALQDSDASDESLVDAQTGTLHLQPGRNTIAVRSCEVVADWRFYFRLENLDGTPVEGLQWTYGPRAGAAS